MPRLLNFSIDFHAKFLDFYDQRGKNTLWLRWSGPDATGRNSATIHVIDEFGELKTLSEKEEQDLINEMELSNIMEEGETIYENVYK